MITLLFFVLPLILSFAVFTIVSNSYLTPQLVVSPNNRSLAIQGISTFFSN